MLILVSIYTVQHHLNNLKRCWWGNLFHLEMRKCLQGWPGGNIHVYRFRYPLARRCWDCYEIFCIFLMGEANIMWNQSFWLNWLQGLWFLPKKKYKNSCLGFSIENKNGFSRYAQMTHCIVYLNLVVSAQGSYSPFVWLYAKYFTVEVILFGCV